jgi:hypothetical protein
MFIKTLRFVTIMLVSLSMGMAFCHLLQLTPRMSFDAQLWRNTQVMYQNFGPPIGAIIEGGAWLSAVALAFAVRHRRPAFQWTLAGAACMVVAQAVWWILINPVNAEMVNWTIETIPSDWAQYRAQWEYTHAARAVLELLGFGALVISALVETPAAQPATARSRAERQTEIRHAH